MYYLMGYEGALYVPSNGAFIVLVEFVVELCVMLVLVFSLMGSVYMTLVVLP